jgi:hypothetical protein
MEEVKSRAPARKMSPLTERGKEKHRAAMWQSKLKVTNALLSRVNIVILMDTRVNMRVQPHRRMSAFIRSAIFIVC